MAAITTVEIRLSLNGLDWITTTGRRHPGPEPVGAGSEAHHTSPRFIGEYLELNALQSLVDCRRFFAIDGIKTLSDGMSAVNTNVLRNGLCIQAATRLIQPLCQMLCGSKHWIRKGNGDFHAAIVSPWYDQGNNYWRMPADT